MTESVNQVRKVEITTSTGQRLDNFLLRELTGVPRSHVYRMVRRGEVRVNGGRAKASYRLEAGDLVRIPPARIRPSSQPVIREDQAKRLSESILFETDEILVLNKPAGVAVHGGSGIAVGVIEMMRQQRPEATLELVHRLDRDTSGILLLAKNRRSLLDLHSQLRAGTVKKRYALLVQGGWPRRLRTVQLPLYKYVTASGERRVRVTDDGRPSRTDFEVVHVNAAASFVRAFPRTGRTHQIRVHAFASGHGIVGDEKYQRPQTTELMARAGIRRLCLHAEELAVTVDGERHRFQCPPPEDFAAAWEALNSVAQAAR